ncbi:hypothetical protein H4219_004025 [Mycoemilia scoparia]|uniref:SCP domain-containing protein n=1 Tax=Mycoemilia scoparia TaxID=417184 RepID=A0A9W7ZYN2_9FUNG|nr:hypothetical protein H4219_004025 [Mycoemilia scoparia]
MVNANESLYSGDGADRATEADVVYAICLSSTIHKGGKTYRISPALMKMAQEWADHMNSVNKMNHDDIESRFLNSDFKSGNGNNVFGENVDKNTTVVQSVNSWINHEGHKENIEYERFEYMGIARKGNFWCQELAVPEDDTSQGPEVDCTGFNSDIKLNKAVKLPAEIDLDSLNIDSGPNAGGSNPGDDTKPGDNNNNPPSDVQAGSDGGDDNYADDNDNNGPDGGITITRVVTEVVTNAVTITVDA